MIVILFRYILVAIKTQATQEQQARDNTDQQGSSCTHSCRQWSI